ncbi:MAG TPA: hypothetical protein VL944_01460 [Candidatus Acidoferrum sp.]|nr:hypothetical protein [Candidatus Acidoferrum sp.]
MVGKTIELAGVVKYLVVPVSLFFGLLSIANGAQVGQVLQIVTELGTIKGILAQIGPTLSAILFIVAGVFYALGQMLPPDKRANFHTTAVNIVIGAIVVGVLSVASTSLATASTHLLSNVTSNSVS